MIEYQNDLLKMVADPTEPIIMANGEPLPEEQRPFLQSIVINRLSMLKRTAAGEDTAATEDALARVNEASRTMTEQNADGKEGTARFIEFVQNLVNKLNLSPTARARFERALTRDTNATTQTLRSDVTGKNMLPALQKAVFESLAYNGEISKEQEGEATRLIQEQQDEWYEKIGEMIDDLGPDGAQKEWTKIRQEWLDELPKKFKPKTELLDPTTDLEVGELLPGTPDRKTVNRYKTLLESPGITVSGKGLGGVSSEEMALSWKEALRDDTWSFTKSGDHPAIRLQDAVNQVAERGMIPDRLRSRRLTRMFNLLQETSELLTDEDMSRVRAHSILTSGELELADVLRAKVVESGGAQAENAIDALSKKLGRLPSTGGGEFGLDDVGNTEAAQWAEELTKGLSFEGFSVYQLRLSDMRDSGKYLSRGADGDTIIWNKGAAKGAEYERMVMQVERILESDGLVASPDAVLKFFAVQRNIWNQQ